MEPLVIALASALSAVGGTAISRFIDQFFARRAHVGPLVAEANRAREELITTLEQTAAARADRIKSLEDELAAEKAARDKEVGDLNRRVQRLETALSLALDKLAEEGKTLPALPDAD